MAVLSAVMLLAASWFNVWARAPSTQPYPSQLVRIVVPFSAGSITDGLARVLADKLTVMWGQTVIVENRPGIAGTASVAKSAPDGYTLMLTSNGHTIAALINKGLSYDPGADFVGVAQVALVPHVLIIPPDFSARTVGDFIALAKQKPGQLNFSSAGVASTSYLGAEFFRQTAKIDMVHIPHKGAPEAITSVMRGESHMFLSGVNLAAELYKAGKIGVLALATAQRSRALPDIPTAAESGLPDYVYNAWFGVMAPAQTPRPILEKVSQDIGRILADPEVRQKLEAQGIDPVARSQQEFDAILKSDVARYTKMWETAKTKAD
jgi:tripartite-type tricarboxylate transporter receptor subunit TctC